MRTGHQLLQAQRKLRRKYGRLFDRLNEILSRHDPIGINFGQNKDEYEPEVGTILPRLRPAMTFADVRRLVHEEFVRWFSPDEAGPERRYEAVAAEIWCLPELSWPGAAGPAFG
jgi:hypothetical protein